MQTNNLNVTPNGVMPRVNVSQYDNEREVHFLLFDGSSSYTPPTGAEIRVEGTKKDGNGFSYACSYSGNNVTVMIKSQMTVFAGDVQCELRISKGDLDIGTLNFILGVEEGALSGDVPISDTEIPAIIELAKDEQFNAEAWAKGTKDGIPVPADDPTYHNNAKWYAEHSQGGSFANLADVDVDNPTNGQVPVYNSATEKWENANASGGLLPHFNIHSEHGSVVTVTYPDGVTTITATETSSGLFECDVTEFGVYTIDAVLGGDDAQVHQTVDTVMVYEIHDEHFSYALSVYAPSGSTIRVTATGESYTGTGAGSTATVFALHQASTTYTIQVTIDGQSKTDTITSSSTTGGSGSVTISFGTINVTYDDDFRGETVTCTSGGTTITKTAPSVGNAMTFYPPTTGTWVIASGTASASAEVTSLSTAVSVSLSAIIQQTITIYSAKEDTVSYEDIYGDTQTEVFASGESSKQITVDINPNGSSITFTSGVAKDPSDLTAYYSKTVTIDSNTTSVYLMPDNALYWWGYENNIEICSNTSGWTNNSAQPTVFSTVTKNTHSIALTAASNLVSALGNPTAVSGNKIHAIGYITGNNVLAQISINPDKTARYGADHAVQVGTSLSYANLEYTFSNAYITPVSATGNYLYLSALWYE